MFPTSTETTRTRFWQLFNAAAHQKKGSMIVIAEDAESEALRLDAQGTNIQPAQLSVELLRQASAIDGSILMDPQRSEEHTSELQSLMRISYAVFCLQTKIQTPQHRTQQYTYIQ